MKKKIELFLHILSLLLLAALIGFFLMQGTYAPAIGAAILFVLNVVAVKLLIDNLKK